MTKPVTEQQETAVGKRAGQTPQSPQHPPTPQIARRLRPKEFGGPRGPEPTRYGDWERNGRCSDF